MTYLILLRNMNAVEVAIHFIETYAGKMKLEGLDRNKFDHVHFTSKLRRRHVSLPLDLSTYLDERREAIIEGGRAEITPWFSLLTAVVNVYSEDDLGFESCLGYQQYLKQFVSSKILKKQNETFSDSIIELTESLRNSASKLSRTRSESDFVSDNYLTNIIARRLIGVAYSKEDPEAYLLGIAVTADHGPFFQPVAVDETKLLKVSPEERPLQNFYDERLFSAERLHFLKTRDDFLYFFLGVSELDVKPMIFENEADFPEVKMSVNDARQWSNRRLPNLHFDDSVTTTTGRIHPKEYEDYFSEKDAILRDFQSLQFRLHSRKHMIVVKDHDVSFIPHNLILHNESEISIDVAPVTCPISLDSLMSYDARRNEEHQLNEISAWVPLETEDFTLGMLHSKLERCFQDFGVPVSTQTVPNAPLTADVNIICAHGSENISGYPAFYASNEEQSMAFVRLNRIIGLGKVLILFVCHSGSMKSDFLTNQLQSLAKSYLAAGYEVVIAPFWALHINIPPVWLDAFLQALQTGVTVTHAAWVANMAVKAVMPTPHAYACLHVYGNPYFRFANK